MLMAAIQMTSGSDVDTNLADAGRWIARAAEAGASLVALPENFAVFDASALLREGIREREEACFSSRLVSWAREFGLWIVGGSVPVAEAPLDAGDRRTSRRVRSRCHVVSPEGVMTSYDKLHLFDVDVGDAQGSYRESATISPGEQVVVARTPWGGLGLSICYDLRFPALFHQLRLAGADIITVPAAFTRVTGQAHWLVLLRARAIETQCWILAPNQSGRHSATRETFGHSCIISPWGEVVALQESGPGLALASFDAGVLADIRRRMPVLDHQRHTVEGPQPRE